MSRFWRTAAIGCAVIAVLGGTLLLMGNLKGSSAQSVHAEQARVEALAHLWESRLEMARSTFRDQVIRHGIMAVLEHPEEWSEWRVQTKFEAMRSTWTKEFGVPRALALFYPDGSLHSVIGDTARLSEAFLSVRRVEGTDLAILGRAGSHHEVLALQYYSGSANPMIRPGRLIALVETSELFAPAGEVPAEWTLLSAPTTILLASSAKPTAGSISEAVWPLMVSQKNGMIEQPGGALLCFSRIQIPGMNPLLLVYPVRPPSAAMRVMALLLVITGTGTLFFLRIRAAKPGASSDPAVVPTPDIEPSAGDAAGLRQIFQAVDEPLCVADNLGHIIRANRKAQEYLHIQKGRPDNGLVVQTAHGEWPAAEFLARAAEDPASATGPFRISLNGSVLEGSLHVARLYRDEEGRGPVLLHFHTYFPEFREAEKTTAPAPVTHQSTVDSHSPFPVLCMTSDGLIVGFNDAARRACPRLDESPLAADVLPALENQRLSDLLDRGNHTTFESLFGPRTYEFTIVLADEKTILYGHPLAESQNLEIELQQAQENFYHVCDLSPAPVFLVDPHEHTIIQTNAAAGDLVGIPSHGLRGQRFDSFSAEPWDFSGNQDLFLAAALSGRIVRCHIRYDLIKVEGAPALLVVLDPLPVSEPAIHDEPIAAEAAPLAEGSAPPPILPVGPGMLITLNPTIREVARRLLDKTGHECEVFSSLDDAVVWLITHDVRPELVVIDLTDFDDFENWINDLRARCGDVPCVGMTDGESFLLPDNGPNTLLPKPFDLESFSEALITVNLDPRPASTPSAMV